MNAVPPSEQPKKSPGTRITVTIPPDDYEVVRQMAKEKKVSASWIVRDAVEKYTRKQQEITD